MVGFPLHLNIKTAADKLKMILKQEACYCTCDDVFQCTVLPLAYWRFHLPLLQLCNQVHLGHLRHHWAL